MVSKDLGSIYYGKHHRKVLKEYAEVIEQRQTPSIALTAWSARAAVKEGDTTTANYRCAAVAETLAERLGPSDYEGLITWLMAEVDMLESISVPYSQVDQLTFENMRRLIRRLATTGGYTGLEREPRPEYE